MVMNDWNGWSAVTGSFSRFSHLSFANFLNLIVFMDNEGNIWLSDLEVKKPVKIYSERNAVRAVNRFASFISYGA